MANISSTSILKVDSARITLTLWGPLTAGDNVLLAPFGEGVLDTVRIFTDGTDIEVSLFSDSVITPNSISEIYKVSAINLIHQEVKLDIPFHNVAALFGLSIRVTVTSGALTFLNIELGTK